MKKGLAFITAGVIIILLLVVVLNKSESTSNKTEDSANNSISEVLGNQINISNFKFTPETITVKKGTTITWVNKDTARHDVNFSDDMLTDGPLLEQNESYSYTFTQSGTFDYVCTPHPYMKATVIVTE